MTHGVERLPWSLAAVLTALACQRQEPATKSGVGAPSTAASASVAASAKPQAPAPTATVLLPPSSSAAGASHERWDCRTDRDCVLSCSHGAVNGAWLKRLGTADCDDGCAGDWMDPPRCIEGGCVAFSRGKRDGACTRRVR